MKSGRFYINGRKGFNEISVSGTFHLFQTPTLGRYVTVFDRMYFTYSKQKTSEVHKEIFSMKVTFKLY